MVRFRIGSIEQWCHCNRNTRSDKDLCRKPRRWQRSGCWIHIEWQRWPNICLSFVYHCWSLINSGSLTDRIDLRVYQRREETMLCFITVEIQLKPSQPHARFLICPFTWWYDKNMFNLISCSIWKTSDYSDVEALSWNHAYPLDLSAVNFSEQMVGLTDSKYRVAPSARLTNWDQRVLRSLSLYRVDQFWKCK